MRSAVSVTLPDRLLTAVDDYARQRSVPRSYAVQELIERQLTSTRRPLAELIRGDSVGISKEKSS